MFSLSRRRANDTRKNLFSSPCFLCIAYDLASHWRGKGDRLKKWIFFILFVALLSTLAVLTYMYSSNVSAKSDDEATAVKKARHHFHADRILSVSYYHGTESFQVVKGVRDGRQMYFWIPDDPKKGKYIERAVEDGITRQQALDRFSHMDFNVQKVLSVRLGAVQGSPVWEITFLNAQGKYNYVSIYYDNGSEAQRILNI